MVQDSWQENRANGGSSPFVLPHGDKSARVQPATNEFPYAWRPGNPPTYGHEPGIEADFDALTTPAHELQDLLSTGTLRSTDLVQHYVRRIEKFNGYLKAIFQYAPDAMQRAAEMDDERARGNFLGPLHGIPIVLKDNICTIPQLGMWTSGGSTALAGAQGTYNAAIVEQLLRGGAVLLGKALSSELNGCRDSLLPWGWSALAGQCQSPYVRGGVAEGDSKGGHSNPGGSSTGSAVAVAAGLAPIAIGSDTDGSLTVPAARAGLYTIRPTKGIDFSGGVIPIVSQFDTLGPLAKDPRDIAHVLDIVIDKSKTRAPPGGYATVLDGSWRGLRIGALDPETWFTPARICTPVASATAQIIRDTRAAYAQIALLADSFHTNIELPNDDAFIINGEHCIRTIVDIDHKAEMTAFLSTLQNCPVKTLSELVQYNSANLGQTLTQEYTGQDRLLTALENRHTSKTREECISHMKAVGSQFDAACDRYDINIIIGPGDSALSSYGPANGYPVASLPLTALDYNGRPIGIQAVALAHQEPLLLKFMSAWESAFPRPLPSVLLHNEG